MILLARLFFAFFFIALFSLGGGYNMLPLMASVLDANGWFPAADLPSLVALAESTPGPIAVNAATFVGSHVGGFFGAFCATFGVVLPSFLIIFIISLFLIIAIPPFVPTSRLPSSLFAIHLTLLSGRPSPLV